MEPGESERQSTTTTRYLRGSSLLLVGRLVALVTNFLVQVLTVRYLAKSDYGAFAYALAVASMGASVAVLGLTRGVTRFVPIDQERREYASMFGTMIAAVTAVTGLGLALVAVVVGIRGFLEPADGADAGALTLLALLICLAPLQALDNLFQGMVAIFARPRELFWRRFVIGPALKLGAITTVVLASGSVWMLAWCHVVAGVIGVALYVVVLSRALRSQGLLDELRRCRPVMHLRRLLGFSVPLLTTDLFLAHKATVAVVILELYRGTDPVAELRAVAPVAGLCAVAMEAFKLLFTPMAARLYAREDGAGVSDLYCRSTAWIALASFPVFCVCFFVAEPITVILFGTRYEGAGPLLAILAVGVYVNAAMGLNLYVLQVYGRVRAIVAINVVGIVLGIACNMLLVPPMGATGAAIAITGTVIAHNLMVQIALHRLTGVQMFQMRYVRVYASIVAAVGLLALVRAAGGDATAVAVSSVLLVSLGLVLFNRDVLEITDTFPELARVPVIGRLLGGRLRSA